MDLKPGLQLASTVCGGRIVVVKAPPGSAPEIACGGAPMVPIAEAGPPAGAADPALRAGVQLGKRYEADDLEVLCTAPGEGTLTCGGAPMAIKSAKPLPASD